MNESETNGDRNKSLWNKNDSRKFKAEKFGRKAVKFDEYKKVKLTKLVS